MVIERFRDQDAKALYHRFQLMGCNDVTLLHRWVAYLRDFVAFEIVPVVPGKDAAAALLPN